MEAVLEMLFYSFYGGRLHKKNPSVKPYYYAFVVAFTLAVVWIAIGDKVI